MAIPTYEECLLPFLFSISDQKLHAIRDIIEDVSNRLSLTAEERSETLSGGQRTIANRVGWARTYLKKAGLLASPNRGMMQITQLGQQVLAAKPAQLRVADLKERFPEFREWLKAKPKQKDGPPGDVGNTDTTPVESIEAAVTQLMEKVAGDLLDTLKACNPYFFEKVVVALLRAMGYGGLKGRALVTAKSGDGGIDGVIYEDKLGLGNVCVQAKRWEGTVGRKVVQEFVGSMDLYRSKKGVIFTTSKFSGDAIDFVERIEGKKVVLIAGEELTQLMIEHGIGVTTTRSYELVDVSQDFFDEEA